MKDYLALYDQFDAPYEKFERSMLGSEFPQELELVSRLWFTCGYRQGIAAYLNFFLLSDFIVTHDTAFPPRFQSFRSMADSFYQTDLFIRDVTDSGLKPTGGISSNHVRVLVAQIMQRHKKISIPLWMMTYFGFSLLENVEKQCAPLSQEEKRLHLAYMAKTYRIMGMPFSEQREKMERFARLVEAAHTDRSQNLEKHAHNILVLGEMVGVSSAYDQISVMLPEKPRAIFQEIYPRVRPKFVRKYGARIAGKILMKQAVGKPRKAAPVMN